MKYSSVLKILLFIIANSADTNEILHFVAFHPDLHCLPNYPFRGFQNTRGLIDQH